MSYGSIGIQKYHPVCDEPQKHDFPVSLNQYILCGSRPRGIYI